MGKLTDKVAKGVFWVMLEKCGIQGAHFVVTLVLARILTPSDYGTVALLSVFIAISNVLVDCGFCKALVQKKDASQTDYNTVFYMSLVFAVVAYAVLFALAPMVARFYGIPDLCPMLRLLAISVVFHSVNGVQNVELNRKMKFKLSFRISWAKTIVSAVSGVALALFGYGPWALVGATLLGGLVGTVVRQLVIAWRPTCTFSWQSARSLFAFGWKMTVGAIVTEAYNNIFALVIGKLYTRADLAFWKKGGHTASVIMNEVDSTIARVSFPALAKMQGDRDRMRGAMRRMIRVSSFFVFPLMAICAVVGEAIVLNLFGTQWHEAVPYFLLACFSCSLKPFNTVNVQAIVARGRSDLFLRLVIVNRLMSLVSLVLTCRYGVFVMVLSGMMVVGPVRTLMNSIPNIRGVGYSLPGQLKDVFPSAVLAGVAAAGVYLAMLPFASDSFARVLLGLPLGLVLYMTLAVAFRLTALRVCYQTLRPVVEGKFPRSTGFWKMTGRLIER